MKSRPVIAITMGDPGGIGPEIILKSLRKKPQNPCLVIGSKQAFDLAAKRSRQSVPFTMITRFDPSVFKQGKTYLLDITKLAKKKFPQIIFRSFQIGKISAANGALALTALTVAADLAQKGFARALVTAPLHKLAVQKVRPGFAGHTEFLANQSKTKRFAMFFYSPFFCVTLVTIHMSLKEVSNRITRQEIQTKIELTHEFLKQKLRIKHPRLAVAALNPHGREFGNEEDRLITPAIQRAKHKGINAEGPLPGDQVFYDAKKGLFHAVVAMYHDQGLAPFKMLAFDTGVNVTLGLPFVRTSPDHGTAFDIAYQNKANAASFQSALKLAVKLAGN
ncbi:MAG: 4-hydroxythreonine-4-phosphate dehydrogenase PdxA [Candidatus Omnitrophica bacterium CG11_big_fil_rev_8_21_14_0_20_45_26]|uniref:4-hydroxythreonine-4-phosphate dehydrogenase PdxA n=1 Tax=Candidatus Abzuiibacterium crystallinum TaxID=1974748 RepID=A0A2H0LN77_9BACT|nr:MAG: 4-hydroxythreonine-4-phosphate dehydrogenase PdxA [Candidatus Omnitrophica bacterium CG11_big_fil_rev_8_21_14_0_20_45_26]PIW65079.1 MAG: 4-hydroxythreonine-4-phosphate dehydrogenase PdxA [Candidatus Omnitrophica bacterium CG12_big_fil_rev_8_21_14_0_65_45_16]